MSGEWYRADLKKPAREGEPVVVCYENSGDRTYAVLCWHNEAWWDNSYNQHVTPTYWQYIKPPERASKRRQNKRGNNG